PLFALTLPAAVWSRRQAGEARQLAAVADLPPSEKLANEQPCSVLADALQFQQQPNLIPLRGLRVGNLFGSLALELTNLKGHKLPAIELPQDALLEPRRQNRAVPLAEFLNGFYEVGVDDDTQAHSGEQPFHPVDVSGALGLQLDQLAVKLTTVFVVGARHANYAPELVLAVMPTDEHAYQLGTIEVV